MPEAVIFDEYHFGKQVNAYCCTNEYFFDVHPPHGKLLPSLVLRLVGYDGRQKFSHIGEALDHVDPLTLRLVPAIAGSLIPIAVVVLLLHLGASSWAAVFGGWMVLFENALVLQSRILALDSQLILATIMGLILALQARKHGSAVRSWFFAFAAGAAAGFAMGVKATGLASLFLVCLSLSGFWDIPWRRQLRLPLIAIIAAISTYFAGWVAHFLLLTEPGPGDIWGRPTGHLLSDILAMQATTISAHHGLVESHPYASSFWSWPLMWRPIFYYGTENSVLYLIGNPLVWWTSSAMAIYVGVTTMARIFNKGVYNLTVDASSMASYQLLLGFTAFFLPHMLIARAMFLYHYLPALVFAIALTAIQLDKTGLFGGGSFHTLPAATRLAFLIVPLIFLLFAPLTFGWQIPSVFLGWVHAVL